MVAEALVHTLGDERDFEVVGRAGTARRALELVQQHTPDVVVVDPELPDASSADLARDVRAHRPATLVIALGNSEDVATRDAVVEAGAVAYVSKAEPVDALTDAIRSAAASGEAAATRRALDGTRLAAASQLTPREREVLGLLAEGLSTEEIVARLVLSPHTVRNHVRRILTKLDAHSRLEAVAIAARTGIIRLAKAPSDRR